MSDTTSSGVAVVQEGIRCSHGVQGPYKTAGEPVANCGEQGVVVRRLLYPDQTFTDWQELEAAEPGRPAPPADGGTGECTAVRDALAEDLSWVSGDMTRWSPTAHPDHNRWSWRGDGHGEALREHYRQQAQALIDLGWVRPAPPADGGHR